MSVRGKIYACTSGLFVFWALAIVANRIVISTAPTPLAESIKAYLSVPYIFLYPVGFALTWFVERSMKVHFKHRILVWIPMACAGGLYLALAIQFFIHSTIV